jgi:hypothetical protein
LLLTAAASNKDQSSESETLISAVEIKPGTQLQPEG